MLQNLHIKPLGIGRITRIQQFFRLCQSLRDGGAFITQLLFNKLAQFTFRQRPLEGIHGTTTFKTENRWHGLDLQLARNIMAFLRIDFHQLDRAAHFLHQTF